MIGEKFGRLTVVSYAGSDGHYRYWSVRCECGNTRTVRTASLKNGNSTSCGCKSVEARTTHGQSSVAARKRLYTRWINMKRRCENPDSTGYERYGGRGIAVCARWRDSYENFLADMGYPPTSAHSIERENTDGDYEPGNCIWATQKEQSRNTSKTLNIYHNGETLCLKDWAARLNINYWTLHKRYRVGKRGDELFAPLHRK